LTQSYLKRARIAASLSVPGANLYGAEFSIQYLLQSLWQTLALFDYYFIIDINLIIQPIYLLCKRF